MFAAGEIGLVCLVSVVHEGKKIKTIIVHEDYTTIILE
jgi:hypothetical protein